MGHRFGRFLQYTSGIEVLACSFDTNLNYVTIMLQLHPSLNHWVFGCILKGRYYITPAELNTYGFDRKSLEFFYFFKTEETMR